MKENIVHNTKADLLANCVIRQHSENKNVMKYDGEKTLQTTYSKSPPPVLKPKTGRLSASWQTMNE